MQRWTQRGPPFSTAKPQEPILLGVAVAIRRDDRVDLPFSRRHEPGAPQEASDSDFREILGLVARSCRRDSFLLDEVRQ